MASTKAKPKMALLNNSLRIEGLRETPNTKLANTIPIPKAAPPKAIEVIFCTYKVEYILNF